MDRGIDPVDYYNNLQGQILADVSARSDLRLNVLNIVEEDSGDEDFVALNNFIGGKIPGGFGYSIRVCEFGSDTDYCKMSAPIFIATMDKDIYVEEIIVSAELGSGTDATYNPKKLRLFVWEGDIVESCDECSPAGDIFSCSGGDVYKRVCRDIDDDGCLEWDGEAEIFKDCIAPEVCIEGSWICKGGATGSEDDQFLVDNLVVAVKFASQGFGVYDNDDNEWVERPTISINGVEVGETTGYGDIFENDSLELVEGKNVVELYSDWGDADTCRESPYADAVLAVLKIDNNENYIIQTDESWQGLTYDEEAAEAIWKSSPYQFYREDGGGCYMGEPSEDSNYEHINFLWTESEACINSKPCVSNCCFIKVKKEFWVHLDETCSDECSSDFYYCYGDNVYKKTCGNFDSDSCLEYSSSMLSDTCDSDTEICQNGGCTPIACESNCDWEDECDRFAPDIGPGCSGIICERPSRDGISCDEGVGICWDESCCVKDCQYSDECDESAPDSCGESCGRNTDGDSCDEGSGVCTNGVCCVPTTWTPSPDDYCVGDTFTQTSNCGTRRYNVPGTKNCVTVLSASYVMGGSGNMGMYTHFDYSSTIFETGGDVGATINSRQKCYYWEEYGLPKQSCDPVKYDIATDYGTNHIIPDEQITDPLNFVDLTNGYSYTVTETFWGIEDGSGNPVSTSYSFSVTA